MQYKQPNLDHDYPGIKFLVQPADATTLQRQLKELPAPITDVERSYAHEAARLLARIAIQCKGPLNADLNAAEPALAVALGSAETASDATTALAIFPILRPSAVWPTWRLIPPTPCRSASKAPLSLYVASGDSGV